MISLNLFELRKSRGITQSYLAEVIGCSFQTISKWETGQSWGDFITGDMQYCRNKAESFGKFIFLMEKLGYEVKVGPIFP